MYSLEREKKLNVTSKACAGRGAITAQISSIKERANYTGTKGGVSLGGDPSIP